MEHEARLDTRKAPDEELMSLIRRREEESSTEKSFGLLVCKILGSEIQSSGLLDLDDFWQEELVEVIGFKLVLTVLYAVCCFRSSSQLGVQDHRVYSNIGLRVLRF